MTEQLPVFVYGTLRAGEAHAAVLDRHAVERIPAALPGHRLHVLEYPCVVADAPDAPTPRPEGRVVVVGEVVVLDARSYDAALEELDRFEGFEARNPDSSLYDRVQVEAETDDSTVTCWVYVAGSRLRARLGEGTCVVSGDWSAR